MLICFYGSREVSKGLLKEIIDKEGASSLLALPNQIVNELAVPMFEESTIDYEGYDIVSWKKRIDKAVSVLKVSEGMMVLFPGSRKTLTAVEEYIATTCKQEGVAIEII